MFSWRTFRSVPLIVGHRGAPAIAPENTLASFSQAIRDGADAIELDVHLTKDNEAVVIHDSTLMRTTSGRGVVGNCTMMELKNFSAGTWFHARFANERLPVLSEIFELLGNDVGVNIEIKRQQGQSMEVVEQCVNIIRSFRAEERTLVSSFYHPYLKHLKALAPNVPVGLLYHRLYHAARSPLRTAQVYNADILILNGSMTRKKIIHASHQVNLRVAEYTVDTQVRIVRALRFGVDIIMTNNPGLVKGTLLKI